MRKLVSIFLLLLVSYSAFSAIPIKRRAAFFKRPNVLASLTAPTFVRAGTNATTGVSTLTISSFNCSGGNYLLVVECDKAVASRNISAITCNGVSMGSAIYDTNALASSGHLRMFGLASPTTGDITVTLSGVAGTGMSVTALLFNGVGSVGSATADYSVSLRNSVSVSLTTVATDIVAAAVCWNPALSMTYTHGATETIRALASTGTGGSTRDTTMPAIAGTTSPSCSVPLTGDIMTMMGVVLHGQ